MGFQFVLKIGNVRNSP